MLNSTSGVGGGGGGVAAFSRDGADIVEVCPGG